MPRVARHAGWLTARASPPIRKTRGMEMGEWEHGLARWATEELPLFEVAGLRRVRVGALDSLSCAPRSKGAEPISAVMTAEVALRSDDDASIAVMSHREDCEDRYDDTRNWVPINPYRAMQRPGWTETGDVERELAETLEWTETTVLVENVPTPFETTDLGQGVWVAVGRAPGAIISIESHGVPLRAVRLHRLIDEAIPPPPRPYLGEGGSVALDALDGRFDVIPFQRVHRWADYWALRSIEDEHVQRLAREHRLSAEEAGTLWEYWRERIDAHLAPKLNRLRHESKLHPSSLPTAQGCLRSGVLFQLWFNTLGPGGRTWMGNRYASIRHHTFRRRWRP